MCAYHKKSNKTIKLTLCLSARKRCLEILTEILICVILTKTGNMPYSKRITEKLWFLKTCVIFPMSDLKLISKGILT